MPGLVKPLLSWAGMAHLLTVIHVLAATIWTGGHLVLALTVLPRAFRARDAGILHRFEAGYEKIGVPALLLQIVTGFALAISRFPDWSTWSDWSLPVTPYLWAKVALVLATLGLALHARLRVLPELDESRMKALAWHVVPVTVMAVLLAVVGVGIRTEGFA